MTRSERLALEGLISISIFSGATAIVIPHCNDLYYIDSSSDELYNGRKVAVDLYEDFTGQLYGVIR